MEASLPTRASPEPIEDCSSEEDGDAPPLPATQAPPGVAGRFASLLGARRSAGGEAPVEHMHDQEQPLAAEPEALEETVATTERGAAEEPASTFGEPVSLEVDAEAETLPDKDVSLNEDGTFTGGPTDGQLRDDANEEPFHDDLFQTSLPSAGTAVADATRAMENEASDGEDIVDAILAEEAPLSAEPWANRPAAEKEMWERVRPRPLRREAARLRQLKLPTAAVNRLMKLHPDLQTKSSEALELVNYSMVLMLQAMARASVRGRKASGQTVRFEDVRKLCLNTQELNFILPVNGTLDSSALVARGEADKDDHRGVARGAAGSAGPTPAGPGQSTLNTSAFARATAPLPALPSEEVAATLVGPAEAGEGSRPEEKSDAESAGEFTPEKGPATGKRKLATSEKKATSKAARKGPGRSKAGGGSGPSGSAGIAGTPGITSFFRRLDAAAS